MLLRANAIRTSRMYLDVVSFSLALLNGSICERRSVDFQHALILSGSSSPGWCGLAWLCKMALGELPGLEQVGWIIAGDLQMDTHADCFSGSLICRLEQANSCVFLLLSPVHQDLCPFATSLLSQPAAASCRCDCFIKVVRLSQTAPARQRHCARSARFAVIAHAIGLYS